MPRHCSVVPRTGHHQTVDRTVSRASLARSAPNRRLTPCATPSHPEWRGPSGPSAAHASATRSPRSGLTRVLQPGGVSADPAGFCSGHPTPAGRPTALGAGDTSTRRSAVPVSRRGTPAPSAQPRPGDSRLRSPADSAPARRADGPATFLAAGRPLRQRSRAGPLVLHESRTRVAAYTPSPAREPLAAGAKPNPPVGSRA